MPNDYSDDRLRLVARLYYLDGLGQSEVARFAKVSQVSRARPLALARERGIVRITVADYDRRRRELEDRLRAQLGLKLAVVIKASDGLEAGDLRKAIGHFAAPVVDELITANDVVALAGVDDSRAGAPSAGRAGKSADDRAGHGQRSLDGQCVGRTGGRPRDGAAARRNLFRSEYAGVSTGEAHARRPVETAAGRAGP